MLQQTYRIQILRLYSSQILHCAKYIFCFRDYLSVIVALKEMKSLTFAQFDGYTPFIFGVVSRECVNNSCF